MLAHVFCNPQTSFCECERSYPVQLGPTKGCAKRKFTLHLELHPHITVTNRIEKLFSEKTRRTVFVPGHVHLHGSALGLQAGAAQRGLRVRVWLPPCAPVEDQQKIVLRRRYLDRDTLFFFFYPTNLSECQERSLNFRALNNLEFTRAMKLLSHARG